jgi:valyl-tRNA synthetase
MSMEKTYDPKKIEEKWYAEWIKRNLFHNDSSKHGVPYSVVIPPPNVTGILHMGHALNNTIQDILVRWHRMHGKNVVWMPGTDHAGIATQNVVERALKAEGKTRQDLGREAFVKRVWEWKEQYGNTIINQLKRLGASCDWQRTRFTMDEGLSDAVTEVFVRLYDKGLIHRGNYIINWCPRCHTALSDEESEHVDTNGKLYYIRYKIRDQKSEVGLSAVALAKAEGQTTDNGPLTTGKNYIVVATTRPETLLGDTAVAINPADKRYSGIVDKKIILPILGREIPVIKDDFVDPKFGTGIVKVTPAHDPNDFNMGIRHGLAQINVMNGDGTMNEEAGPYKGMDRFECRKKILTDLGAEGLIEKIEDHQNAVGHCYRCHTVVEPRLSLQWFVKMKPLAEPAIKAVKNGRIEFVPERWNKVYLDWMENIRDWCISRQIWWGHRIPVFYCDGCGHEWAAKGQPAKCPKCGTDKIRQDEDVLDTWFSSWLWPFSTFGWPKMNDDLSFYYPTQDMVTASEIIFFWVARMIMAGFEFRHDVPFRKVYIHGTVRDDKGRKMSKSLGNSIDPLKIIDEFSADALRFSLMMITATGQDVYISNEKFEIGRNFGTKMWNAARFMQMHDESGEEAARAGKPKAGLWEVIVDPDLLSADDKHLLAGLQKATSEYDANLEKFRFNDAAHVLYEFIWHQFCDWYVEYAKDILYGEKTPRRKQTLGIMHYVFSNSLRLAHPFMPFITEELWHAMGYGAEADSIMLGPWPKALEQKTVASWQMDAETIQYVDDKHELIRIGRMLRSDYDIAPLKKINYVFKPHDGAVGTRLAADSGSVKSLLRAEALAIDAAYVPPKATPSGLCKLGTIYMPLEGLIDIPAERARLSTQVEKLTKDLERVTAKLSNANFVDKAPKEVVDQQKNRQQEIQKEIEKLNNLMGGLSGT